MALALSVSRLGRLWLLPALCLAMPGCGPRGPEMVPVQGKITLGGKAWPQEGALNFLPVESPAGVSKRAGAAHFDREGNFRAGTFGAGDGLLPGRYKIVVECWEFVQLFGGPHPKSYVPAKYRTPPQPTWN